MKLGAYSFDLHQELVGKFVFCSTLLVPPEKLVRLLRLRAISFKPIFSAHRDSVSRMYKPHESDWIMMFKSGGSLIFGMQEEIQTLRKSAEQI